MKKNLLMFCAGALSLAFVFTSCSDDDDSGTTIGGVKKLLTEYNTTGMTDSNNDVTTFEYDAQNRLKKAINTSVGQSTMLILMYDSKGQLSKLDRTDVYGENEDLTTTTFTYKADTIFASSGDRDYDNDTLIVNDKGWLLKTLEGHRSNVYTYDGFGNMTKMTMYNEDSEGVLAFEYGNVGSVLTNQVTPAWVFSRFCNLDGLFCVGRNMPNKSTITGGEPPMVTFSYKTDSDGYPTGIVLGATTYNDVFKYKTIE